MRPLPGTQVLDVIEPADPHTGTVRVIAQAIEPKLDPAGRSLGWRTFRLIDLNSGDNPVEWTIRYRRRKMPDGSIHVPEVAARHQHHASLSARGADSIAINSYFTPFAQVAARFNVSETLVARLCKTALPYLEIFIPEAPKVLGIDEAHIGGIKRTVLSDAETGKVLDVLSDQKTATVVAAIKRLRNLERVEVAVMDFYRPYRTAVRQVFGRRRGGGWRVRVVIDRWHAEKQVRQVLQKRLAGNHKDRKAQGNSKQLRRTFRLERELVNAKEWKLSEDEQGELTVILSENDHVAPIHAAVKGFLKIWRCRTRPEAEEAFETWAAGLAEEITDLFAPAIALFRERWIDVFAFFDTRVTGARVEKLNDFIKDIYNEAPAAGFRLFRMRVLVQRGLVTRAMIAEAFATGVARAGEAPSAPEPAEPPATDLQPVPASPRGKRAPDPRQTDLFAALGM